MPRLPLTAALAAFFTLPALLHLPVARAADGSAVAAFDALLADERAYLWRAEPLSASQAGVHDYDDRLPAVTPADQADNLRADQGFLARLQGIDRTGLDERRQVSYDLFDAMVTDRVTLAGHREWRMPLNSDSGFHTSVLLMHQLGRFRNAEDYRRYLDRLREVPRYFAENIDNMRQGMRDGFTLPAAILDGVSSVMAAARYERPEDSPLWQPFAAFPPTLPETERQRLARAGRQVLSEAVLPAYAGLQRFFEDEYRPAARPTIAATDLPEGAAYYADLVRYFTTLPEATAQQMHETGLAEVARIRAAMQTVVEQAEFDGDVADFIAFLRSDPQFYATSALDLLKEASYLAKKIDGKLPGYFATLPRTPYGVEPVPAALAPNYTGGRYNQGGAGQAGEYWVNTYALDTRPLYVLPALTLHEAVPGHHLQISLAREQADVPAFRREFYPHAFGEGWGLYAERLGEEMGMYTTPYQQFGRLTYDMWRACRLVVDTGMHAYGWSRQRALDYLGGNTALSTHEVRTEVDRYIAWPGQALAYKTGELEIVRLRAKARQALGERFDLRGFHDAVLANGGVTLPVLARQVDDYVERTQAETLAP